MTKDSTNSRNATGSSNLSEVPLIRLASTPEGQQNPYSVQEFTEESTGLVIIRESDLQNLQESHRLLIHELMDDKATIAILRDKITALNVSIVPDTEKDVVKQYKIIANLVQERQEPA